MFDKARCRGPASRRKGKQSSKRDRPSSPRRTSPERRNHAVHGLDTRTNEAYSPRSRHDAKTIGS
jgi:hypothetical protein